MTVLNIITSIVNQPLDSQYYEPCPLYRDMAHVLYPLPFRLPFQALFSNTSSNILLFDPRLRVARVWGCLFVYLFVLQIVSGCKFSET